jgi:HD-GYP domain-containing protein (c-di-GMP phosphodiesterase class II)
MVRRRAPTIFATLAASAAVPVALLAAVGDRMVMPPMWVHFTFVGATALVATAAAIALTVLGARRRDARTVAMGTGFSAMAALLAVHGLTTPTILVGSNGVVALSGALTLPVGAAILMLAGTSLFSSADAIHRMLAVQAALAAGIVGLGILAVAVPDLVPSVPETASPAALALLVAGLAMFVPLAIRAARTFLLTRRSADLAVVVGIAALSASLYGALMYGFMDLGWWLGHLFEFVGIALIGSSLAYDLRRGRRSRPLLGDLRAGEIVLAEEAFLGARVRALMVRLAEKDASTEEHTRRVAALAVEIGERMGLSPARLRSLAIGGLLHDIGKLSIPDAILKKPGALSDEEFGAIKQHPVSGSELIAELSGFDPIVEQLVRDHHERLDGHGYPSGLRADEIGVETRILTACDVFDALVSPRVYRGAWSVGDALELLHREAGTAFDPACVAALVEIVAPVQAPRLAA